MRTISEDLSIGGRLAVMSRPEGEGPWPGVVMLHEAWGVDDVLRRHAERMASAGYLVLAPDLLGEGLWLRCISATMRAYSARSGRPFELIEAARQALLADPRCTGQVGVIGFCMGGGFALLVASDGFDVASVNYGEVPEDAAELLRGACPIVASYGGRDSRGVKSVARLRAALTERQIPSDVEVYPTAGHSFLNHAANGPVVFRPLMKVSHVGPDPVAAADAWRRIEAFFGEHLDRSATS